MTSQPAGLGQPERPTEPPNRWDRPGVDYNWDMLSDDAEADRRVAEDRGEIPMRLRRRLLNWLLRKPRYKAGKVLMAIKGRLSEKPAGTKPPPPPRPPRKRRPL